MSASAHFSLALLVHTLEEATQAVDLPVIIIIAKDRKECNENPYKIARPLENVIENDWDCQSRETRGLNNRRIRPMSY